MSRGLFKIPVDVIDLKAHCHGFAMAEGSVEPVPLLQVCLTNALLTLALHGGEWSVHGPVALHPAKEHRYPVDRRLGGPRRRIREVSSPVGNRRPVVQPIASL